jgi:RNA polymerase sigma-70 factor (ECF subfamily)
LCSLGRHTCFTNEYSFQAKFVQAIFFRARAATKAQDAHRIMLSSFFLAFPHRRSLNLPFFLDSALYWPLVRPIPSDACTPLSPEREVTELFDELQDRLLRYLLAVGLSLHDGEEIIQDSFLLLFQHLQDGKSRQNLRGWVFRVARNLALKQRSANQLRVRRDVEFDETLTEQHVNPNLTPEEELESRVRQTRLLAVVRALPERDRSCLIMRAEGLHYREIAEALGISLGSVAASLARSLARLGRADGG